MKKLGGCPQRSTKVFRDLRLPENNLLDNTSNNPGVIIVLTFRVTRKNDVNSRSFLKNSLKKLQLDTTLECRQCSHRKESLPEQGDN